MMNKILTLCIIHDGSRVLLGMKKRGFGVGRWNGFGGKMQAGETVEDAARREVKEEAGIDIVEMELVGIIEFEFSLEKPRDEQGDPDILEVHIFKASTWSGEPTESEEMRPQWFEVGTIPFSSMWPDDMYWFPLFLTGKKFRGKFLFGKGDVILEHSLGEVLELI